MILLAVSSPVQEETLQALQSGLSVSQIPVLKLYGPVGFYLELLTLNAMRMTKNSTEYPKEPSG